VGLPLLLFVAAHCAIAQTSDSASMAKSGSPGPAKKSTHHSGHSASKTAAHKSGTTHTGVTHSTTHTGMTHTGMTHSSATHSGTTHVSKTSRSKKGAKNSKTAAKRGQQIIDADRARAIQEALIREHYMEGEASGMWDSTTQAAMQRYQADQGWRALIKLGLGPSTDHLLNPESAMTSVPGGDPKAPAKPDPPKNVLPQQ
jgi:hypothetical protein